MVVRRGTCEACSGGWDSRRVTLLFAARSLACIAFDGGRGGIIVEGAALFQSCPRCSGPIEAIGIRRHPSRVELFR